MAKKDDKLREGKVVETPDVNDQDTNVYIEDDSFLLPNDGDALSDEQKEEEQVEMSQEQQMFVNDELAQVVFDWLDSEIKDCDSIQAALAIAEKYKKPVDDAMIALDLVRKVFEAKKVSFQDIYDTIANKETNS